MIDRPLRVGFEISSYAAPHACDIMRTTQRYDYDVTRTASACAPQQDFTIVRYRRPSEEQSRKRRVLARAIFDVYRRVSPANRICARASALPCDLSTRLRRNPRAISIPTPGIVIIAPGRYTSCVRICYRFRPSPEGYERTHKCMYARVRGKQRRDKNNTIRRDGDSARIKCFSRSPSTTARRPYIITPFPPFPHPTPSRHIEYSIRT